MTVRPTHSGFESRTRDPERRDFYDLRRRIAKLEGAEFADDGGGSPFGDEVFIGPNDPGAASGYELWYDTDAVAPLDVTRLPKGYVGRGQNSGAQTIASGADTDVTGCTVTWTADPNRRYKITAKLSGQKTVAGGDVYAFITDAAGTRWWSGVSSLAVNESVCITLADYIESGQSGLQTRKLRCYASAGSFAIGTGAFASAVLIEDIGAV